MRLLPLLWFMACAVPVEVGAGPAPCSQDTECSKFSVCEAQRCVPCPDAGLCQSAPPLNQLFLSRNACPSCTPAPPSQCEADTGCTGDLVCARGLRCVEGCSGLGCCANVCSPKGCSGLVPVGCNMACGAELGCAVCVAAKCVCTGGAWRCVATCTSPGFDAGCQAEPF